MHGARGLVPQLQPLANPLHSSPSIAVFSLHIGQTHHAEWEHFVSNARHDPYK